MRQLGVEVAAVFAIGKEGGVVGVVRRSSPKSVEKLMELGDSADVEGEVK